MNNQTRNIDREILLARNAKRRAELQESLDELKRRIAKARRLAQEENPLTKEIQSRLSVAKIGQVDRSVRAKRLYLNKVKGENWFGTSLTADAAMAAELDTATHLLITELGFPEGNARYRIAMRLVHVRTGRVVWADDGERAFKTTANFSPGQTPHYKAGND